VLPRAGARAGGVSATHEAHGGEMVGTIDTEVVVAGAGPVGLVAALALARAGVAVALLEKRDALNAASKASTFHPPTLEILAALGVLDEVIAQGEVVRRIQYRTPDGPFAEFSMSDLAPRTAYPFRLHLEQARVTPVMLARFAAMPGARVMLGTEFAGVEQRGDGVVVRARRGDGGEVELRARYLVGADGAHSAVRRALGIAFEGAAYPHKILRVMTTDDLDAVLPGIAPVTYLFNAPRSISFLRMPDCWRIILRVPDSVDDATAMRDDWLGERLVEVLPSWTRLPSIAGRDVYGVSRRVASRYAEGAAFLAGDSAHVTNTRGGMNMNCGMHDAFALAGAMATALRGGDPACVARASGERRRVAEEMLIPRTDRAVAGGDAWLEKIRATAASPADASAYLATAAMLDMLDRPGAAS